MESKEEFTPNVSNFTSSKLPDLKSLLIESLSHLNSEQSHKEQFG